MLGLSSHYVQVAFVVAGLVLAGCQTADRTETGEAEAESTMAASETLPEAPDLSASGLEQAEAVAFFNTLKQAVARGDSAGVAGLVAYPITVQVEGEAVTLADAGAFATQYGRVLPASVRKAILESTPADLWANAQGVRIGDGKVWYAGVYEDGADDYQVQILAINP